MNILITGHHSLGNRGCEAILRSTVASVRTRFPKAQFWVPSSNPQADGQQWTEAADCGVSFVETPRSSLFLRAWARACRWAPFIVSAPWPTVEPPASWNALLPDVDLMMVIGGDNYTLDYGLESLALHVGLSTWAMKHSRPVVLWGASVGPFDGPSAYGRAIRTSMARHLGQMHGISARESLTASHLQSMFSAGSATVDGAFAPPLMQVTDPAFNLLPQPENLAPYWPRGTAPVLGLNISPHVVSDGGGERAAGSADRRLDIDVMAQFIRQRCSLGEYRVVCIPHVSARNGSGSAPHAISPSWDDDVLMDALMERLQDVPGVTRLPAWDAPRLKYAIAQCDLFMGARTHSVIAALSSGVPTVAIAYSMKAHGIHRDLFGHERGVLDQAQLSAQSLNDALDQLAQRSTEERAFLMTKLPHWRAQALQAVDMLPEPNPALEVPKPRDI